MSPEGVAVNSAPDPPLILLVLDPESSILDYLLRHVLPTGGYAKLAHIERHHYFASYTFCLILAELAVRILKVVCKLFNWQEDCRARKHPNLSFFTA